MFDDFFIGSIPKNADFGSYAPVLVCLSYIMATFGSYTGLTLALYLSRARDTAQKRLLHLGGALAFGNGIWSMHFIGMLSFKMTIPISYDPLMTALSMFIAVSLAYSVLQIIQKTTHSLSQIFGASILVGIAISAMHYTGMAAMNINEHLRYLPSLFALSVAVGIVASYAALWIIFRLARHQGQGQVIWRIAAALIMGAGICGMHYTGMAAAVFIPIEHFNHSMHNKVGQNLDSLAMLVTIITSVVLVIFLAIGELIKEDRHRGTSKKALGNSIASRAFSVSDGECLAYE